MSDDKLNGYSVSIPPDAAPPPALADIGAILRDLQQRGPETALVEVPGFGAFRVRGLTRAEVLHINQQMTDPRSGRVDQGIGDELTLTLGVVEPKISREQYRQLRHHAAANALIVALQNQIVDLTNGPSAGSGAGTSGSGREGGDADAVSAAAFPAGAAPRPGV